MENFFGKPAFVNLAEFDKKRNIFIPRSHIKWGVFS